MSQQAKKDKRIAKAARKAWVAGRKTKLLPPLSRLKTSSKPYENGQIWRANHDQEANDATVDWMYGNWDEKRIEAWNLWIAVYFPTLCEASQTGTMEALFHSQDGYQSVMDQVVQCIDETIFGGRLAPYCKVVLMDKAGVHGEARSFGTARMEIAINLGLAKDVLQIYGTILHELCHVHENLLGCSSGETCRTCVSDAAFPQVILLQHPYHFLDLSWHVQELASSLHLEEIDLGRDSAYTGDCDDTPDMIPEQQYLWDFFTRPSEFKHVNMYRLDCWIREDMAKEPWERDLLPHDVPPAEPLDSRLQPPSAADMAKAKMPIKHLAETFR